MRKDIDGYFWNHNLFSFSEKVVVSFCPLINEILKKNQDQDKARGGGPCFKGISQND